MKELPLDLAALEDVIRNASAAERQHLAELASAKLAMLWLPQPGPQTEAFFCPADELLYGGAAGGGKTDLIVGLATTAHQRSLIFRAQSKDLDGFWDRLNEVTEGHVAQKNDVKRRLVLDDNRLIEGGHLGAPGSERDWQGRPHDLIAFDEAAQLAEMRVLFVMQWLRSTDPTQRKRVVFATNPPIPEFDDAGDLVDRGLGEWLKRWFAPWIDDLFPNPAKPGELRWCFMRSVGDRQETVWVAGPGRYDPETAEPRPDATEEEIERGKVVTAKSRTFIKSLLSDNAFLKGTGYAEKLSTSPEPLKSMLLNGDFTVRGEDHPMQVVPTQWVLEAQRRWRERPEREVLALRQLVLYADIAQGGADTTVIASLCDTDYFDELLAKAGRDTPDGKAVARLLLDERLDGSLIVLDATGGYAGATAAVLEERYKITDIELHKVSQTDGSTTPDLVYKYANLRSKMWWEFRLALDPAGQHRIALPPSNRLLTQLTTPHWFVRGRELFIESKDELRKRLMGASTDEADAVLGAWQYRDIAMLRRLQTQPSLIDRLNGRTYGEQAQAGGDYDPRSEW